MIHINIALLLMAGTFVLGWLFEGICLRISQIRLDARNWRNLREEEELAAYEREQAAIEQLAWEAQQKAAVEDW